MYLPYIGQDLDSNKKAVGILAHVWHWPVALTKLPDWRRLCAIYHLSD